MAGFIRRYGYFPGTEVITQIEGTVIVDLPPPGAVEGIGTGTVGIVGEFADCTYTVQAGSAGEIDTKLRPVEAFSTQDLLNKVGGFDETLGDFGNSLGNGFVALRNKRYSRLVLAPINLSSTRGARFTRQLPLCTSQTNTLPVVPVSGATITAGREFRNGVGRIRVAQPVQYTARNPIDTGTGGSVLTAGAFATTQPFEAAPGYDWTTLQRPDGSLGAKKGDILVIGNNNSGAVQPLPIIGLSGAGTYRVALDPTVTAAVAAVVTGAPFVASGFVGPTSAVVTGAAFVASGFVGGEQIQVSIDGAPATTVTFLVTDQTPAQVAAAINTALGSTVAADGGGFLTLTSPTTGPLSAVFLAEPVPGVLAAIGLVAGTTNGVVGETLTLDIDGGGIQVISFTAAAQTPAQVAAVINAAVGSAIASGAGGFLTITSPTTGLSSTLVLANGVPPALAGIGLVAGTTTGADAITNVLNVELLDGTTFDFVTESGTVPWRLHFSTDADSAPERVFGSTVAGGYAALEPGGYVIAVRPLTDSAGLQVDGNYAAGTAINPAVVPPVLTGNSADPLSGLSGLLHPVDPTAFTAAVQGINPVAGSALNALYSNAIDALISEDDPARDINIVVAARKSSAIRSKLRAHVLQASEVGLGRMTIISPELTETDLTTIVSNPDPGVGANRDERVIYSWPGARHSVPEAVGYLIATPLGTTTSDGILDDTFDHWYASLLSNLAPERNPGQAAQPVPTVFAPVIGTQRGVNNLGLAEYTALRRVGVSGLRIDRTVGPIIQSGITTSLISGQKNVNRRRMADFIEDSLARRLVQFTKLPLTNQLKDGAVGECDAFLNTLLSPNNPAAQRISAYSLDDKSGNTPELEAKGIFVIIARVRTLATADFIVVQAEIGEGVNVQVD